MRYTFIGGAPPASRFRSGDSVIVDPNDDKLTSYYGRQGGAGVVSGVPSVGRILVTYEDGIMVDVPDQVVRHWRKNPVSSRTRAKHAALMAAHRYEDAAKIYKRAMGREKRKNPQHIEWSGMTGKDARGNVYKIQDKSRPGDPWFTIYLIPPAGSWAGGVVEPMASRDSVRGVKDYAEQTAARMGAQQNPRRRNPTGFKKFIVEFITTDPEQVKRARSISERWKAHSVRKHADGVTATFPDKMDMQKVVEAANGWGIPTAHGEKKRKNPPSSGLGGTYVIMHANPRSLRWVSTGTGTYRAELPMNMAYLIGKAYVLGTPLKGYFNVSFWKGYSDSGRRDVAKNVKGLAAAKAAALADYNRTHGPGL